MINLYNSSITDILPDRFTEDPRVQALGFSLSQAVKKLMDYSAATMVYAAIDSAAEEVVDLLALELKTQYYDVTMPLSVKRDLVKNTFAWYKNAGTEKTLNELITAIFGSGDIIEWWEDPEAEADPFTYKIRTEAPITGNEVNDFSKIVRNVVNIRSHLSAVEFTRNTSGYGYFGVAQTAYTINNNIKEGGL